MPARMPIPMPGPMTPRAARPAPMCSICRTSSTPAETGSSNGGRSSRLGHWFVGAFEHRIAFRKIAGRCRLVIIRLMTLNGNHDEHEGQDREDEGLDQVQQRLEAD